ncbi:uncharacterized protein LOC108675333 isoform X2 [Hyalella azteca]|uniref:Uncharacterized protein LOC108675333 isoform X2 n=3 Tax=Hyalella azteca TaxID=294128 RepID=A0A979FN13_HYAAZ|nr:uncharacterized protein LOC108675333 isoform X2 [Hyalella azteca]
MYILAKQLDFWSSKFTNLQLLEQFPSNEFSFQEKTYSLFVIQVNPVCRNCQVMDLKPLQSVDNLSKSWLEKMLSSYHRQSVFLENYELDIPSKTQGFLSDIFFLKTTYYLTGIKESTNLVVKLLPSKKELINFIKEGYLAEREVKFYEFSVSEVFQRVLTASPICHLIPKIYYSAVNESSVTLVMEDLRDYNYEPVIVRDGSDLQQTVAIVRSAAVVHAAGVLYRIENGSFPDLQSVDKKFYDEILKTNLKYLASRYAGKPIANVFSQLIELTNEMYIYTARYPLFDTIIHGDLWAGQSLFSSNRESVCLIDWQFCAVGNPVIDLQGQFFMSTDPVVLDTNLEEILKQYWSSFNDVLSRENVASPCTFQEFSECVDKLWICGFFYLAVSIHDFIDGGNISDKRLDGYVEFLSKRRILESFLESLPGKNVRLNQR